MAGRNPIQKIKMKRKKTKHNSPRLESAIRRACKYAHSHSGWWYAFHSDDLGELVYLFAYKADKYDVLNALCSGTQNKIITFARGDIRHRKRTSDIISLILMVMAILLMLISLRLVQDC